jgi:hypothetical protein
MSAKMEPGSDPRLLCPAPVPLNCHNYEKSAIPLGLCHPTAPHEKLKLPEWYVSSLMMDRALDAICRRVKKFDRKHDIPYLAGYSLDGETRSTSIASCTRRSRRH